MRGGLAGSIAIQERTMTNWLYRAFISSAVRDVTPAQAHLSLENRSPWWSRRPPAA